MKKIILIQARLSSSRFPKKMLSQLKKMTLVEYVYSRCKESRKADSVVIITSNEKSDDELYDLCIKRDISVFRGSLDNVLKRYMDAGIKYNADIICRVCGDSPFVDVKAIDKMFMEMSNKTELEYITTKNSINGFLSEAFTLDLMKQVYNNDLSNDDLEHVTKYVRDNILNYKTSVLDLDLKPKELEDITLTIDYPSDIQIARKIVSKLKDFSFSSDDIIKILNDKKSINEL